EAIAIGGVRSTQTQRSACDRLVAMCNLSFAVLPLFTLLTALATGCSDDGVNSDEEARRAYLGLDGTIAKSLNLGMDGFNAADSANIPEQSDVGDESGTLVINGKVDQGSS